MIKCWHGVNNNPRYFPFENCSRVLIPFNLIFERIIPISYVQTLENELMIDSGAARYFLNTDKGYPEKYLEEYVQTLEIIKPTCAFGLDFCFENNKFRTDQMLEANFRSQRKSILLARSRGITLFPIVQGWNKESYQRSARDVKEILEICDYSRFGVGSICRAKKYQVSKVLTWISEIVDLSMAHAFGQTQRTIPILKFFNFASFDTANASSNAAHNCYCDPFGNWFYSQKSRQGKVKHNFELLIDQLKQKQEYYRFLFEANKQSLEFASEGIPKEWLHPVYAQKQLANYLEAVNSHA